MNGCYETMLILKKKLSLKYRTHQTTKFTFFLAVFITESKPAVLQKIIYPSTYNAKSESNVKLTSQVVSFCFIHILRQFLAIDFVPNC